MPVSTTRKIVAVEYTRGKAAEMANYCREGGEDGTINRHPRIYKRNIRAENLACEVFVVVADTLLPCPIRSLQGAVCGKNAGHKARCTNGHFFWGDGKPEAFD